MDKVSVFCEGQCAQVNQRDYPDLISTSCYINLTVPSDDASDGQVGNKEAGEERFHDPTATPLRSAHNETADLPEEGKQDKARGEQTLRVCGLFRGVNTKKVRSRDFSNPWTNYKWIICTTECTRDFWRLDLESHMLPMSISGQFNYCNAVASLLHLAEWINGLHWSTYL